VFFRADPQSVYADECCQYTFLSCSKKTEWVPSKMKKLDGCCTDNSTDNTTRKVTQHVLSLCTLLILIFASLADAHEIPERVQTKVLIHEGPGELRVLIRVPLEAMRDIDFPTKERGYLDLERAEPLLRDAMMLWVVGEFEVFENGVAMTPTSDIAMRVSLPSDRSFERADTAIAHMEQTLNPDTLIFWRQALLDIQVTYQIPANTNLVSRGKEAANFSINSGLGHLGQRTSTSLVFINLEKEEFYYDYTGSPGLLILAPDWYQVAAEFVKRGVFHIWEGIDHILFLLCLILPLRKIRALVWVISSFTLGHSITLVLAALGMTPDALWFSAVIEVLIALSVIIMALDNILVKQHRRRWLYGLIFGLIHGFGFSFVLTESLQFSGNHLLVALLGFNLGVEIGQIVLLLVMLPILGLTFRYVNAGRARLPRPSVMTGLENEIEETSRSDLLVVWVVSAIVAHAALHWLADQWGLLSGYL
jgi:hypothetical protein